MIDESNASAPSPTAVLVGASRCYLGVHYPGDVVIGWLLGTATWIRVARALVIFLT